MRHRRLNGWRRLALMPVLLLVVLMLVLAGSFAFRGTAHAQSGATATFTMASTAKLIARTTLQISLTATCTLPAGATFFGAFADVTVSQASGRVIVSAGGGSSITCDGTAQTFQVLATPPVGTAPFHGGPASATGSAGVEWEDALGNFHEDSFFTNPQVISIQG
jgi:hypothetical protein